MSWSAAQYAIFEQERTRPVRDLVNALPAETIGSAMDIGCGPGNSTEVLAARYPDARIAGMDSSADMVEAAQKRLPQFDFEIGHLESWTAAEPLDVILSNAVLHWVPDHETLLPRLVEQLAPGGSLAVQMPDNLEEPVLRLMGEVAADGPWAARLANLEGTRGGPESIDWYYTLLRRHCARVDIWRTVYHHTLAGGLDAVVEWFKGSAMRPYLQALDGELRQQYLERYKAEVAKVLPPLADGSVLLPFPRLFFIATR